MSRIYPGASLGIANPFEPRVYSALVGGSGKDLFCNLLQLMSDEFDFDPITPLSNAAPTGHLDNSPIQDKAARNSQIPKLPNKPLNSRSPLATPRPLTTNQT
jgi:hypothetical protein